MLRSLLCSSLALILLAPMQATAKPLPLATFTPYFQKGPLATVPRAIALRRYAEAARTLQKYLAQRHPRHAKPARFLLAYARLQSGDGAGAAALFVPLITSYPLLADYSRYYAARATYKAKRFAEAERLAAAVDARSVLIVDAQLLRADALLALHRPAEAAPLWRSYLRRRPGGARIAEARLRIAEDEIAKALALKDAKDAKARQTHLQNALRHYKAIVVDRPLARQVAEAKKRVQELARQLPGGAARWGQLSANELFRQSLFYYRKQRNKRSERGFAAALKAPDLDAGQRCRLQYYRAKSIFKQRQRDRAAGPFLEAAKLCRRAKRSELTLKSLYNRARGLYSKGLYLDAAQAFLAIEREFPQHSYADDARLRAAEAYAELKRFDQVTKLLDAIPKKYPQGDQAREALWRLARRAYFKKRYKRALALLDRIDKLGLARRYYEEGRALYWRARILGRQGKRAAAQRVYERTIRDYPLSYYALVAFNRLREQAPGTFRKLRRELLAPIGKKAGRWVFADDGLGKNPYFRRGMELLRLGFSDHAARELTFAGLGTRKGPKEQLWRAAVLFDRAGQWQFSHQVPRSRDHRYKRSYPLGENVRRWRIAYPRAFPELVQKNARSAGIPLELAWAIMREESGFTTRIESYANAIGLMQLILPTARAAGGRRVTREDLQRPATNIRLGTSFLGFLMRAFARTFPLAIAGYNAGHGAVYRWLARYRGLALDELLERVPYDQTRRYTKRVLASLFAYSILWGKHQVPRIPLRVPQVKRRRLGKD